MPTFTIHDDEVLLDRLLKARSEVDRQAAWRELVQRFSRLIASCVRRAFERWRVRPTDEDVDDLVSEVWIALLHDDLRRLRAFDATRGARLSTFVGLIATNVAIDRLRLRRIDAVSLDQLESCERALSVRETITSDLEDRQRAILAQRALARLPSHERQFCTDVFAEERDPAVLARELGVTKTTIYTRKVKVRDKLRRLVGEKAAA